MHNSTLVLFHLGALENCVHPPFGSCWIPTKVGGFTCERDITFSSALCLCWTNFDDNSTGQKSCASSHDVWLYHVSWRRVLCLQWVTILWNCYKIFVFFFLGLLPLWYLGICLRLPQFLVELCSKLGNFFMVWHANWDRGCLSDWVYNYLCFVTSLCIYRFYCIVYMDETLSNIYFLCSFLLENLT